MSNGIAAIRATVSRVLFQMLVESAMRCVQISTPYFLPDKAFRRAFVRTAGRGVEVTVIVPGALTDQKWVRLASRRMLGDLLKAGVRIFEYGKGMTHVKALLVDDLWEGPTLAWATSSCVIWTSAFGDGLLHRRRQRC